MTPQQQEREAVVAWLRAAAEQRFCREYIRATIRGAARILSARSPSVDRNPPGWEEEFDAKFRKDHHGFWREPTAEEKDETPAMLGVAVGPDDIKSFIREHILPSRPQQPADDSKGESCPQCAEDVAPKNWSVEIVAGDPDGPCVMKTDVPPDVLEKCAKSCFYAHGGGDWADATNCARVRFTNAALAVIHAYEAAKGERKPVYVWPGHWEIISDGMEDDPAPASPALPSDEVGDEELGEAACRGYWDMQLPGFGSWATRNEHAKAAFTRGGVNASTLIRTREVLPLRSLLAARDAEVAELRAAILAVKKSHSTESLTGLYSLVGDPE